MSNEILSMMFGCTKITSIRVSPFNPDTLFSANFYDSVVAIMKKQNVKTLVTHDTDIIKLADKGIIQVFDPIPLWRK